MRVEQISDATLYLGDCLDILPTLGKADAVVTDPPYGMSFQSNYRLDRHMAIANDSSVECLTLACGLDAWHSKYIFCRWDNLTEVPKPKSAITWVKNNWSMGDLNHEHARQTELLLFYPGESHDFPLGRPTDVLNGIRTGNGFHPTEKPVDVVQRIVEWTRGTVIDPFMGSGTTGVACANLGRKFIGIELEPKYFDIACLRIETAYKQPRLFAEPAAKVKQEAML